MKEISKLEETPLGIAAGEVSDAFAPFVTYRAPAGDGRWQNEVDRRDRKLRKKLWRRRLLGFLPQFRRTDPAIEREYSEVWDSTAFDNYRIAPAERSVSPWEWRQERYMASRFGGARVKIMLAMRVLELTQPQSVLEVGAGNGVNLLFLSGRFPQTRFTGLELTAEGVAAASGFQAAHERFPADLAAYSPWPLRDDTAFKRVEFTQGSAQRLPFADNSFDLVMTVLALEQMEAIRADALREISRVARRHVLSIEPFRDVNRRGGRRRYVLAQDYLQARLRDLSAYGLDPLWATDDFPQKAQMAACCVLSAKRDAAS